MINTPKKRIMGLIVSILLISLICGQLESKNAIEKFDITKNMVGESSISNSEYEKIIEPAIQLALYTPHNPIVINGNADFYDQATNELWSGNGTPSNPYQIRGYDITNITESLIDIRNTNVSFEIADCFLNGSSSVAYAVYLNNVANGFFSSNSITNATFGFFIDLSKNITVSQNVVENATEGLYLRSSETCNISSNSFTRAKDHGLSLYLSNRTIINDNNVSYSGYNGIGLYNSNHNNITNNDVYGNSGPAKTMDTIAAGIYIDFSDDNRIFGNNVHDNILQGARFFPFSSNNIIRCNNFISNNPSGFRQALDDGTSNSFKFNYWDDWTSPDVNNDGFIDNPYFLDGYVGNKDDYPLAAFIEESHFLLTPTVEYPNGGETVSGRITIQWKMAIDSLDHHITYSIYFSADNGTSWYQIVTGITTVTFNWNTASVANASTYLIKITAACSQSLTTEDASDNYFTVTNAGTQSNSSSTIPSTSSSTSGPSPGPELTPGWSVLIILVAYLTILVNRIYWNKLGRIKES